MTSSVLVNLLSHGQVARRLAINKATTINNEPMASRTRSSEVPPLASPKINNEANIASGTTALLDAASTPTLV